MWVLNRMPNFGKAPRPPVRLYQLNPYMLRHRQLSDDALEIALDNMARRSQR